MKQVIKGKTYDTTTAQVVGFYRHSTLYRRVKAKDYFLEFRTETCLKPISEYEAEKMMYRSGEFVWDE